MFDVLVILIGRGAGSRNIEIEFYFVFAFSKRLKKIFREGLLSRCQFGVLRVYFHSRMHLWECYVNGWVLTRKLVDIDELYWKAFLLREVEIEDTSFPNDLTTPITESSQFSIFPEDSKASELFSN